MQYERRITVRALWPIESLDELSQLAARDERYKRITVATAFALHWISPVSYIDAYPGALTFLQEVAKERGVDFVMGELNFRRDVLASFYGPGDSERPK